jgi:hypothetical protein
MQESNAPSLGYDAVLCCLAVCSLQKNVLGCREVASGLFKVNHIQAVLFVMHPQFFYSIFIIIY